MGQTWHPWPVIVVDFNFVKWQLYDFKQSADKCEFFKCISTLFTQKRLFLLYCLAANYKGKVQCATKEKRVISKSYFIDHCFKIIQEVPPLNKHEKFFPVRRDKGTQHNTTQHSVHSEQGTDSNWHYAGREYTHVFLGQSVKHSLFVALLGLIQPVIQTDAYLKALIVCPV